MRRRLSVALLAVLVSLGAEARTASELQLALRKLNVLGTALYVAAHPDDENTAMLSWFASERLYRTGYLSVTRGDGGQNLIGDEKGALLGVIRTQELLEARTIDRAEQFFTRAIDFGYSKTAEETMGVWDREAVLADVVWTIRRFRPDVIVTRFPTTGEGGHGQHTASAIFAEEAFRAAADPTKFPDQLRYVAPWQPKRVFWNRFSWQRIDPNSPVVANDLRVDLGAYNPLLGRAYTEIAAESRSEHKSQGFGSAERRGTVINYYKQTAGAPAKSDLFEGIDTTWNRVAGSERVSELFRRAHATFDPLAPGKSIPLLLEAYTELERLGATDSPDPWIDVKRRDLLEVIRDAAGLSIDISAAESAVTPGGEIALSVSVVNRSDYPFVLSTVASPNAKPSKAPGIRLENNEPVRTELTIGIPADYPLSQPYWLRDEGTPAMFRVDDQRMIGLAENPASIPITVSLTDPQNRTLIFTVPAVHRRVDPVAGEQVREVEIVPPVTVNLDEQVYLFPDAKPKDIALKMRSFTAARGAVKLIAPAGWRVAPASIPVSLDGKGAEANARFSVTPPATESNGTVRAEVELEGGQKFSYQLEEIDYEHIEPQRVFPSASARLVRLDLKRRGQRIGYIMGPGDDVAESLRQAGFDVVLITDADLDRADFSRFDAIVAGVRAYNTRERLRGAHPGLMGYVENGGTYVVQYNTMGDTVVEAPGPYPFKISRDRVAVEGAPVTILAPTHPVLTTPNRITSADFEGWVQERGLYFPGEWDAKYETLIATNDPGEPSKPGSILVAKHGKGVFIYTGLSFFRQLPAGIPGAYRLFVNLVSSKQ